MKKIVILVAALIFTGAKPGLTVSLEEMRAGSDAGLMKLPLSSRAILPAAPVSAAAPSGYHSQKVTLRSVSAILATSPIPGGCVLAVNAFHASPFAENLNVGIIKARDFTDILMVGNALFTSGPGFKGYKYEAVSTEGSGTMWQDYRVKDAFELRLDGKNRIMAVTIEKYREKKNMFGKMEWGKTSSVTCRN